MQSKKIKLLIVFQLVNFTLSNMVALKANAEWQKDLHNNWNWTEDGVNVIGWNQINGDWYYFDSNGNMKTGWIQTTDSKWYYMNSNGVMKTGWLSDNGKWYNLGADGEMKTSWLSDNGKWYNLGFDGAMKTGWIQEQNESVYFLDALGIMQTGVVEIQGKIYEFKTSGLMQTGSTVINGETYRIDVSGAILGDKLPTPEKVFTNEGIVITNSVNSTVKLTSTNISENKTERTLSSNSRNRAEPVSHMLSSSNVMVINSAGIYNDKIIVNGLESGDVIRIYNTASGGPELVSKTTSGSSLEVTANDLLNGYYYGHNPLMQTGGTIYVSVDGVDKNESGRIAVNYGAEPILTREITSNVLTSSEVSKPTGEMISNVLTSSEVSKPTGEITSNVLTSSEVSKPTGEIISNVLTSSEVTAPNGDATSNLLI